MTNLPRVGPGQSPLSPSRVRLVRGWRRVDRNEMRRLLEVSPLCQPVPDDVDVNQLFSDYDSVLHDIADKLAPLYAVRRRPGRPTPWFDDECHAERRRCRRLERRYRRTRRDDRRLWVEAARRRLRLNREKRECYWLGRLNQCGRSSSQLRRLLSPLLGRDRDVTGATGHTADDFADYFKRKVSDVRSATAAQPPPPPSSTSAPSTLASFRPCTLRCDASSCSRRSSRARSTQCRRSWCASSLTSCCRT